MSDKTTQMALLFDFFGDLLTEKQREYFDLYYNDDLSLAEIAEGAGISRQGVRDNLVRAEASLKQWEEKTGVVARFQEMQKSISEIEADLNRLANTLSGEEKEKALAVIQKVQELKG